MARSLFSVRTQRQQSLPAASNCELSLSSSASIPDPPAHFLRLCAPAKLAAEGASMMADKKKRTSPVVVRSITLAQLKPLFTLPLADAAQQLDISETCLKRLCRRLNLEKWPYRELNDVRRTIAKVRGLHKDGSAAAAALLAGLEQQEQLLLTTGRSDVVTAPPDSTVLPIEEASDETAEDEQEARSEESAKSKRQKTPDTTPITTPTIVASASAEAPLSTTSPSEVPAIISTSEDEHAATAAEAKIAYNFPHPYLLDYGAPPHDVAHIATAMAAHRHTYPYPYHHPAYVAYQAPPPEHLRAWLALTPEQRQQIELQRYHEQLYGYPQHRVSSSMPWYPRPPHPR